LGSLVWLRSGLPSGFNLRAVCLSVALLSPRGAHLVRVWRFVYVPLHLWVLRCQASRLALVARLTHLIHCPGERGRYAPHFFQRGDLL